MKTEKLKIVLKTCFASLITILASFFAQTSVNACTVWMLDQPEIPEKLLKKD